MINPKLLKNEIDLISKKLASRKFKLNKNIIMIQDSNRKIIQLKIEKLQAKRNLKTKLINLAKIKGNNIDLLCQEVIKINKIIDIFKVELHNLKKKIYYYLMSIPNIPADEVPCGLNKYDNLEISRWGKPRQHNFNIKSHIELGKIINGLDFITATKITGTRFVIMQGQIAYMYRALIQFMLDLHTKKHGYQEYYLPYLVNDISLYGTGQLPRFYKDLFRIKKNNRSNNINYYLIPTAEVPLINLVRDKIIDECLLPLKMTAHTPCFRAESNSYGSNTRGLIRMHQFDKVEIVQIVKPENSMNALEEITNHAETVLQLLNLPYRKVLLCTGDISFASCKTYDLEVWLPSRNSYYEISSCSNTGDFQARRIKARYRNKKDKKLQLVHTLNGSGLAIGRTLLAVLENYQLHDGKIEIPFVLRNYMNGLTHIG